MISYPRRALSALAFLFRPFNDLDVFVEDTASRNLYEVLLNRVLGEQASVSRVFQLGGREEVIEACRDDQAIRDRKRIYIIDGDYDILTGQEQPNLKHLYRLSVYCSENLVVSDQSLIEVAYECNPNESKEALRERLAFDDFSNEIQVRLFSLLVTYLAAHILDNTIQTISYNVTQLIVEHGGQVEVSPAKVEARIHEITLRLEASVGKERLQSVVEAAKQALNDAPQPIFRLLSGKTYVIPLVFHFLHRKASYRGSARELVVRLARHCELDIDVGLQDAVIQASRDEYKFAD